MLSNKPYFIRALYEWIVDSECTPYLLIDATKPRADVPEEYVEDGQIVLDISPSAITELHISNRDITFVARFSGVRRDIYVPINAVLAIYAMENEQGMFFDDEDEPLDDDEFVVHEEQPTKPKLHIVEG